MGKTATITLGDIAFEARAFTLGEQEELIDAIDALASASASRDRIRAARTLVAAAWATAEPGRSPDDVAGIQASLLSLFEAATAVMALTGLRSAPAGEAGAGRAPA